ncbi:amidohydrolase family protein [Nocardia sp. NPDC101769]|uniref:amidohydrolase family protein n=1 Tax=Nocardia sp. NPDC101769 TaxID=3364333 RepID=UPI003814A803
MFVAKTSAQQPLPADDTSVDPTVLKRFYYDVALSASPAALPSLLAVAEPDHITYGSDFPFAPPAAVDFINNEYENYPLDDSLRAAIDRGNAEVLFPRLKS